MKPTRLLQRILVLGETHFVGRALMEKLLEENLQLECWVFDSTIFNHLPTKFHTRLHLLDVLNRDFLLDGWKLYRWDTILHIVSNYADNCLYYKSELQYQKSLLGDVLNGVAEEINFEPLYVEIDSDWVFAESEEMINKSVDEKTISYLETYSPRISIDTTNILSVDMQASHWIFNFISTLKSRDKFGVPCDGMALRDWIAVEDYIDAICVVLMKGELGNQYTVVGFNEWTNYDLMLLIGATYDRLEIRENGAFKTQLCNEKIVCRSSYKETKMGVSYIALDDSYSPRSIYDVIEQLVTKA